MISLDPTEITLLRETVASAMSRHSTSAHVRIAMATRSGWDRAGYAKVAGDLGMTGLAIPEEYGGSGTGFAELAVVFEQTGAALFCSPLFATTTAAQLLIAAADPEAMRHWLPAIADGSCTATVAFGEAVDSMSISEDGVRAARNDHGWALTGTTNFVVDGATADLLLVVADAGSGPAVFTVPIDAAGVTRTSLMTLDQTRKLATLSFDATPVEQVRIEHPDAVLHRVLAGARTLLAAEQVGGAQRCLDITVNYAKTRFQFGRAVGSFQAVKERLAEMLIRVESARSSAYAAARALDDDADIATTTLAARITCTDAFDFVAAQCIQLHGGIGFTWEHDAHLYFKRARSSAELLGTGHDCVEALAAELTHA